MADQPVFYNLRVDLFGSRKERHEVLRLEGFAHAKGKEPTFQVRVEDVAGGRFRDDRTERRAPKAVRIPEIVFVGQETHDKPIRVGTRSADLRVAPGGGVWVAVSTAVERTERTVNGRILREWTAETRLYPSDGTVLSTGPVRLEPLDAAS